MKDKNYILVGLGPHAKRIYYPLLEKHQARYGICLKLLIELEEQRGRVEAYLTTRTLQPERILYLTKPRPGSQPSRLDDVARAGLDALVRSVEIYGMIISTEPQAHKRYAAWALENNVNVLMDKPISAPLFSSTNEEAASQIYQDYCDLERLRQRSAARCYVTCQRRNHAGYVFLKEYLKKFVSGFEVPVSYIDIYHADGAWNLPHEFSKENHPYKYGYGKLMHSGYHFVDLFAWIADTNSMIERARPDTVRLSTARFSPNDFFAQIGEQGYAKLFNRPETREFFKTYQPLQYEPFGELDAFVLLQLLRQGRVITTGSINLQQNSFSTRGWFDLPEDTYKGNGRIRHERVNIQVSHFLNLQARSYQSGEPDGGAVRSGDEGSNDHFDLCIYRNKKIIGGDAFQKISFGKALKERHAGDRTYLGHNELAREATFVNFIEGKQDESEFVHHRFTNQLLSPIYASITQGTRTGNSGIIRRL